jgi:para-nitrobenzyl esterase
MKAMLMGMAATAALAGAPLAASAQAINAMTDTGAVSGAVKDGVLSFKGIPFAAPPVGQLRWRPPQPAAHWSGIRPATEYGHDCMQKPFPSDAAPLGTQPAEDCLVLNVWRPADTSKRNLPVMVWIYGGGFVNGGSSPEVYAGDQFAKQGVIMVSFNYRVGRFGFFGFPALTAEHPDEPKANYGYMDEIAALQWVKANIAAFGGNPDNVTVFGESAGGGSVHMLLTSPVTKGLFNKAIIESGGGRASLLGDRMLSQSKPGLPSLEEIGINFAKSNGIDGTDAAALAKLRALSAEQVTNGLNMASGSGNPPTYGGPALDGKIVTGPPQQAYEAGTEARAPLIIGTNSADIGFSRGKTVDEVFAPFGARKAQAMAAYKATPTSDVRAIGSSVGMDQGMGEPARFTAAAFAAKGEKAYVYRFGYVADSMQKDWKSGAPHATEIPYVFDTVAAKYGKDLTAKDESVARAANTYWVNFAKTGDPNGPGLPHWPAYTKAGSGLMDFQADGKPVGGPDPWKARLDVVAEAADARK